MKRLTSVAMIAAVTAAIIGVPGAQAADDHCIDGPSFTYCGEYVPAQRLPLVFKLNNTGKPSGLGGRAVAEAAREAMETWNLAWPAVLITRSGVRVEFGNCAPLCYGETTNATAGVADGSNTIGWGDPESCDGSHAERIAVACLWYEDTAKSRIREVDIVLNADRLWAIADPLDAAIGEVQGSVPARPAEWYDLEAVLTHEFGHALGLDDIGDPERKWPANFEDLTRHDQTMYRWYVKGSTNKRTLGWGDILALTMAARESAENT